MIAAIYARRSHEQNVSEDAKSVTRQIELGRAFAADQGWSVIAEYVDDGISGALSTKLVDRARMLAAAGDGKFDAVIVRDYDRLSRDDREGPSFIYALEDCGVEIWYYADRSRVDTRTAMHRGLLSMKATFAAAEREAAQQRTREAMRAKAKAGHVAGGVVFGYQNVRVNSHVEREITPTQAAIIRRIFEEVAQGRGFLRIADGLNAEAIPCPRTGRGWAMTGVREIVYRDLYRGRLVYGRTQWDYRKGRKFKVAAPESEWITVEKPELRIIADDLWQEAHQRLERTRQTYLRLTNGKVWGRPESGIESNYLLTGFLECASCGGGLSATWRFGARGRRTAYYRCNTNRARGVHVCANAMTIRQEALESAILTTLREDVLTPDVLEAVIQRAAELYASEPDATAHRRQGLTSERQRLQGELSRYAEAIALSGPLSSILEALTTREGRLADVNAQLEHLDGVSRAAEWGGGVGDEIRRRLTDWQALIGRQPALARQILRKLLVGRLVLTPKVTAEGRWYEYSGQASYGRLLAGVVRGQGVVPPG